MSRIDERAQPLADPTLIKQIHAFLDQAKSNKQVKIGANETTKALNRGLSEFVVVAADANPLEIVLHIPLICEDKNVSYVFVPSKKNLGRSCGIQRPVIACAVIANANSPLSKQVKALREQIEKLLI